LETEVLNGGPIEARVPRRASLSVALMTAGPGPRVAALLATVRAIADEILVALDDRAEPSVRGAISRVADRIVTYPFLEPVDRPLPWLFELCTGEWALFLDDDEIPSLALVDALPSLCRDEDSGHYWIARRWLYPTAATYLDDEPWRPDYQLRLVRRDRRLVRFSDEFHRPIVAAGPGRFVDEPLWHVDPIVQPYERRLEKVRRYERERPGMRIAGRAYNVSVYLPETRADPPLAELPGEERAHVEAVLAAAEPSGPTVATVDHGSREEIDRLWSQSDTSPPEGRLELLQRPREIIASTRRTLDVRVHNQSGALWPWGDDCLPRIRVASQWAGEEPTWTLLPAPIEPGASDVVPVHVHAPDKPGRRRLELRLVEEHVGSFGEPAAIDVDVVPQRRVALLGAQGHVSTIARILEEIPEIEIVLLRRSPSLGPGGYAEAPDARSYLFDGTPSGRLGFAAAALWRSLRLRVGPTPARAAPFLAALRGCELLVLAGTDGPPQRRERWATRVASATASGHGIPVAETVDPAEILRLLRRG
jgi:hypothetical protein